MTETEQIVSAIFGAVITDLEDEVPKYCERNQGARLITRLKLRRAFPRRGDASAARSLYTAIRFFVETEGDE